MINFLIGWCLKNRFLVILLTLAILVAGIYCLRNTPVDAIPDIGEKQVIVYADWPGRDPKVVEDQVTFPADRRFARYAGRQEHPLHVGVRLFDGLRDLPGRYRLLLGSLARAGTHERRCGKGCPRKSSRCLARMQPPWARSTGTRSKPTERTWPSFARFRTGMSATSFNRSKGCPKSPRSAASLSSIRSTSTRTSYVLIASC